MTVYDPNLPSSSWHTLPLQLHLAEISYLLDDVEKRHVLSIKPRMEQDSKLTALDSLVKMIGWIKDCSDRIAETAWLYEDDSPKLLEVMEAFASRVRGIFATMTPEHELAVQIVSILRVKLSPYSEINARSKNLATALVFDGLPLEMFVKEIEMFLAAIPADEKSAFDEVACLLAELDIRLVLHSNEAVVTS